MHNVTLHMEGTEAANVVYRPKKVSFKKWKYYKE